MTFSALMLDTYDIIMSSFKYQNIQHSGYKQRQYFTSTQILNLFYFLINSNKWELKTSFVSSLLITLHCHILLFHFRMHIVFLKYNMAKVRNLKKKCQTLLILYVYELSNFQSDLSNNLLHNDKEAVRAA